MGMIARIGQASSQTTTVTVPAGHAPGDLIVIFAFRDGNATNPTIPAGWTTITNTLDTTSGSASCAWKIATSTSETSGTWTNASSMMCVVLRGADFTAAIMAFGTANGVSTTVTYGPITRSQLRGIGSIYMLAFAAHRSSNTAINTPPTGTQLVLDDAAGATAGQAAFEALSANDFPSTNVSVGGTSSGWCSIVLAIERLENSFQNYKAMRADFDNTGIMSSFGNPG